MTTSIQQDTATLDRGRRRAWMGVAALAAGAAGVGWVVWQHRAGPVDPSTATGIWQMAFDQPNGPEPLKMSAFKGRPLLLNFWATWCPPCVEEMPLLDAFYQQNAGNGWQVLGIAVDQATAVRSFLKRLPVTFPIAISGVAGADLGRQLGNVSGGMPFTVVFGRGGGVVQRKVGKVDSSDLEQWLIAARP